jgi:hypothetical protein
VSALYEMPKDRAVVAEARPVGVLIVTDINYVTDCVEIGLDEARKLVEELTAAIRHHGEHP